MGREKLFTMRMSVEEWARAEGIAAHLGVNVSSMLRMLLKREADELGLVIKGAKATRKPAPKARR